MAQNVKISKLDPTVAKKIENFRFRKAKNAAAIVLKIRSEDLTIIIDDEYEDVSIEELQTELPEHQPRYIVYSYVLNHDGRVTYPMCFIYCSPMGCKPELNMMYAGSKNELIRKLQITNCFEVRAVDELTDEWLEQKLFK